MTDVLVAGRHLTRRFGAVVAVTDTSLELRRGEIVGLLGANGAGKTTLIRMLLGLLRPSKGDVELLGMSPSRTTRRRVGYVAQGLGLYSDLTVAQNVSFHRAAYAMATDIVLPATLRQFADRLVGEIGLGRQRQLAFACALGHAPELIVLDEPTSGVDPLARARLWDRIHDTTESGIGALVTTHYLQEAQQCDRLVVMAAGRVMAAGTPAEIIGSATAVVIRADSWTDAFEALDCADFSVMLTGRDIRVGSATAATVRTALDAAGVTARVETLPATLDEVMVAISQAARR